MSLEFLFHNPSQVEKLVPIDWPNPVDLSVQLLGPFQDLSQGGSFLSDLGFLLEGGAHAGVGLADVPAKGLRVGEPQLAVVALVLLVPGCILPSDEFIFLRLLFNNVLRGLINGNVHLGKRGRYVLGELLFLLLILLGHDEIFDLLVVVGGAQVVALVGLRGHLDVIDFVHFLDVRSQGEMNKVFRAILEALINLGNGLLMNRTSSDVH